MKGVWVILRFLSLLMICHSRRKRMSCSERRVTNRAAEKDSSKDLSSTFLSSL